MIRGWGRRLTLTLAAALAVAVVTLNVPTAGAQEDAWPELDELWGQVAAIEGTTPIRLPQMALRPIAQASSRVYEGQMKLRVQAVNFYGQPVGPSQHQIPAQVIVGPPAGTRASGGVESNEFSLLLGAKSPGQATPYDLWIKSADTFATSTGPVLLQYWTYSLAETREARKGYQGSLTDTHVAEAAAWNQLMIPTQIYPNGPQMQFPQPLDVGSQIGTILADGAVGVAVRGTAGNGQYPFAMELYAEQVR